MKTLNTSVLRFALPFLLLGFVSCTIDPAINQSPNYVTQDQLATTQGVYGLLVGLQVMAGDFYSADRSQVAATWSWQVSVPPGLGRAQPEAWMTYTLDPTGPPDDSWKNAYKAIRTANDLLANAPKVNFAAGDTANRATRGTIIGIAEFYKALCLGEIAALFGAAPISIQDVNSAPFVSQAEVYAEVQRILDDALTNMTAAGPNSAGFGQDLNFQGDATRWIPAIHSLKARYYLHVHDYTKALSESQQGITAATGDVFAHYSNNVGENSPWGHWVVVEQNIRAEKAFVDSLRSEPNDKRLTQYFSPNANGDIVGFAGHGEHIGTTALDSESLDASLASTINKYGTNDASFPLISYAENILIRAETEALQGNVSAAVTDVNVIRTAAGLTAFASSDPTATVAQILKQKWLQLFLEGQSYHDMRRTKTMYEVVPHTSSTPGNLRWIYPQSETNANHLVPPDDDALAKPLLGY